ncbi:mannitol dehydrogenase family protein [Nocardioides sp. BP30]|uniref:mannitol dehydrogenase family protein n=1 Tax=Nocardioides sp. BP30 TaxID=3036374 RepID=UPI0024694552|nr:mannitol dehydrogenase family protein [Nocardioides sp. BP30]WGL51092.1 mannitol dehydrogenase family protein [Nocardioides sp. BP30]
MSRLSLRTLPRGGAGVRVPVDRPRRVGVVHLGIGAFHRAHQAVFTEDAALAAGEDDWGICGITQRSATVLDQLVPQDFLYSVLERGGDDRVRVVGQVADVLFAAESPAQTRSAIADPGVSVVTLTVTEKGYRRRADGGLDLADPAVAADLSGASSTAVGQLVRGLQARARGDAGPLSVLSCDNLAGNGGVLRRLVREFCAALPDGEGEAIGGWVEEHVAFPSSMVDRIVPATSAPDRALVAQRLGVTDHGVVVAEPFRQWVIEDDFAARRPAWELAGAELVDDVAPYERLKLRTLNATHSLLAYLGALRGHATIAEAVADEELRGWAEGFIREDVAPTLAADGLDVLAYGGQVLDRFANPALRHRTAQVAMDGSQKLPLRVLPTVRARLDAGATPEGGALIVAAWMAYVARCRDGGAFVLEDPLAERLLTAVGDRDDAAGIVDALLGVEEVFGADLREVGRFRDALTAHLRALLTVRRGSAS